jgi:D-amino-acid oxidase
VRAVVVGAGISGLTCALRLREAGHAVELVAARPPERTTSAVAAALWYPYRAFPYEQVLRWGARTYATLTALTAEPGAGVRLRSGRELFLAAQGDPWWRDAVPSLDRVPARELPAGYVDGLRLQVPVVDTSVHLAWLRDQLRARDVPLRLEEVSDLATVAPDVDVVVNCAGLGSGQLLGDETLVPVRGQVVVIEQTGVTEWLLVQAEGADLTYVVPRETSVVLGGTAEVGATALEPDPAVAAQIVARCAALVPAVAGAAVIEHKVGLRPTRPAVRLESGRLPTGQPVVHDYGHGGAGVTLSYGCADDVVRLVEDGSPLNAP